jgi:hypothetical protein
MNPSLDWRPVLGLGRVALPEPEAVKRAEVPCVGDQTETEPAAKTLRPDRCWPLHATLRSSQPSGRTTDLKLADFAER